ncbi:sensor histidine kinase [Pseudorhodoferax sp.]|uniref:sensor histidine kinase n=1 Tax=Pseudorhodoferax sp. TaxID=1993553 RepID=UPI002DD65938|nr:ATP-binding protein [Pseudorhodoferax sp.]
MSEKNRVKMELERALAQGELDHGQLLSIAHDLAAQEPNAIRFSVDASHISRLGIELVSKQETAISELIKNAYDADAIRVDVVFKDSDRVGGVLEIIDNGTGMSREQLVNGFMRISTQGKVAEPSSTIYGRQRAGRKGIGRFAAQRLGRRVTIQTQLSDSDESLKLEINWENFSSGADIFMIANRVNTAQKMASPGTTIRIEGLRDAWSNAQIRRAYRYISDLLQPFPLQASKSSEEDIKNPRNDPGFHVYFYQEEAGDLNEIASDEQNIFAHALAKISGQVISGTPHISIESKKHNISIKDQKIEFDPKLKSATDYTGGPYQSLNGVSFSAHYFITDELPGGTKSTVRDILNRAGGIRLYRNGFRVLPYGENFDDWVGLQRSSALRQILPPHHNTNFLGFVEIFDVDGSNFEETASREGLIENAAFSELHDFVYKTLLTGVIAIAHARKKKIFASDKPRAETQDGEEDLKNVADKATALAERIRDIAEAEYGHSTASRTDNATEKSAVLLALAEEVVKISVSSKSVLEEIGMLRVLASLGLTIGEFTHEVRHVLAALKISVSEFKGGGHEHADLNEYVRLLSSYTRYFDQAVSQNSHRKLEVHELRDVIGEFATVMAPTLKRQNIEVVTKFEGYDLFTKPMHKSEWASTLLNLFTNSLKAIQRAKVKNGRIQVFSRAVENDLEINFSDNGDGIPEALREQVFEAFFTTSAPASALASESEQITGTGLGLKIVRDIIEASDGEIEVVDPPEGFSTCFRIVIPRAEKHEIDENEY